MMSHSKLVCLIIVWFGLLDGANSVDVCPGSPAKIHAKCVMEVTFEDSCENVRDEIIDRLEGKNGWVDPHNQGVYTLRQITAIEENDGSKTWIEASRLTGDRKYVDKFNFVLTSTSSDDKKCVAQACSESQVFSIIDFNTNFCNLFDLYCNSKDNCPVVKHELTYKNKYENCSQNVKSKCIAHRSSLR